MADVFSDDAPAMVDCDVLEAAKENIQPLASGRRVTALSSILATPHVQREPKLNATRNRLRINIELALEDEEEGDPLEAYSTLVNWTLENYPQGHSAESGLLELLEEATRVLKDDRDGKWRKEIKYLKLWMLYASFVEKPGMIYRFLLANEIGTNDAILYEEYAAILERDGRRKEADRIYALGIARKVSHLERLKSKHADFQKRMMCAAPAPEIAPPNSATNNTSRRTILATTSSPATTPLQSSSSTSSSVRTSSRTATTSSSSSNVPLRVFVDPTGSASQSAEVETNSWPDIGTRKSRVKENVPDTKKMAGSTIRQAGKTRRLASASSSSSASKIVPFRDPGPDENPPPPATTRLGHDSNAVTTPSKGRFVPFTDQSADVPASVQKFTPFRDESTAGGASSSTVPGSVMKLKKPDTTLSTSEAEALRKDPLKNYDLTVVGDAYEA
ncbi:protein kinase [Marasmius tenuissimus]|uniref:Protein kinase n=1 Tax=Marasmius tenuissimus TaxID=585030 RepID=A0ABR3A411_9AGAR